MVITKNRLKKRYKNDTEFSKVYRKDQNELPVINWKTLRKI